jgi:hypothetical protein
VETVRPERLTEALSRLRSDAPVQALGVEDDIQPAGPSAEDPAPRAWLRPLLKTITAEDPTAAGRLIVALLPAQLLVHPDPVAYDLILGDRDCLLVTAEASTRVDRSHVPRPDDLVDFRVKGDLESLARLIVAGRLRRRFGRHVARIQGDRRAFKALRALGRAPVGLSGLFAAGVRLDPPLMLALLARMIAPKWTSGERFTVAYEPTGGRMHATYLHVRNGDSVTVTPEAPLGPVATTLLCPAESLQLLLVGTRRPDVLVRGDERPVTLLQEWVLRAQAG